jgi:hypothetical protein
MWHSVRVLQSLCVRGSCTAVTRLSTVQGDERWRGDWWQPGEQRVVVVGGGCVHLTRIIHALEPPLT